MRKVGVLRVDQSVQRLGYGVDDQRFGGRSPSVARIFRVVIVPSSMPLYMDKAVGA